MDINPSSYYIKNCTGEIISYQTTSKLNYEELQPDEQHELNFELISEVFGFAGAGGH